MSTPFPPRALLERLSARQAQLGHGEEGFVSIRHGFLPITPPIASLPRSHAAWDQVAAELPRLFRDGGLRRTLESLPPLPADPDHLEDGALCRAASLLGIFAHAYARERDAARRPLTGGDALARFGFEEDREGRLPPQIEAPWRTVCLRLGRPGACLSLSDLVLYNWRLRNPDGPRIVENLDLNTPTIGIDEERFFYLTIVESLAVTAPVLDQTVRAQEACLLEDADTLKEALLGLGDTLRAITRTLQKIDPNPHGLHHTDPIVWSRFVAPFAAPVRMVEPGLSGAAAPVFHLLDAFFGRARHDTKIGRETKHLADWSPRNPMQLVDSLRAVDVSAWVERCADSELRGVWRHTLEGYAGSHGWLGAHRLKVYGFMECGFKAGRLATNGGFSGKSEERAWERLDRELDDSRRERFGAPPGFSLARRVAVRPAQTTDGADVFRVTFDTTGTGLRFQAGDRCAVLPRNRPELVRRTLKALQATGDEAVPLDRFWTNHMRAILGGEVPAVLPLSVLLTHGQLRPVARVVGKRLHALSRAESLYRLLEARREDECELWEIFEMMREARYDVRRLWQAAPWEPESLARVVHPAAFRVYSIASAPDAPLPRRLDLSVRALRYGTPGPDGAPDERVGMASHFLSQPIAADEEPVALAVIAPPRFAMPPDPQRPIVMFAGGSGIAPFRGFWQTRCALPRAGRTLLVIGVQNERQLAYRDELESLVEEGRLEVSACFSREDAQLLSRGRRLLNLPASRGYVDGLISGPLGAELLRLMMPDDGAPEANLYLCGSSRFAHTVHTALQSLLAARLGSPEAARAHLARMVAHGRLMQDIFTTFAPSRAPGVRGFRSYDASEVALHNNPVDGYWMALRGQVYDITEFLETHPGGHQILIASAGTDATRSYEAVEHHLNPEVHAMLDLFKIGAIRRLDFGGSWGVTLTTSGVTTLMLRDCFTAWVRALYQVVEAENALQNNRTLRRRPATRGEPENDRNALKARVVLELRAAFEHSAVESLVRALSEDLWQRTTGLFDASAHLDALNAQVRAVQESGSATGIHDLLEEAQRQIEGMGFPQTDRDRAALERAWNILDLLEEQAVVFLGELKRTLCMGVRAFEAHEGQTPQRASPQVMGALRRVPELLAAHHDAVHARAREMGLLPIGDTAVRGEPQEGQEPTR